VRVVNEHDIFRGALWPAAAVLLAWALVAWWTGRAPAQAEAPRRNQWLAAAVTTLLIGGLLGGVTLGYLYAVEAAAAGGMALLVFALAAGAVSRRLLLAVLRDTIVTTGALFALLVGATVFTLVLRVFETDRWVAATLAEFASPAAVLVAVLALIALCAFVLDAFEIIFVVIPVVMPPLLTRVDDAVWVSVLTLLILQASFVLPPFGYAIMLVRRRLAGANLAPGLRLRELARACVPYLLAQLAVLMLVLAWPRITGPGPESIAPAPTPANGKEPDLGELLRQQSGAPEAQ
jgi:TRAP-type mannitol/chloroaromatic compound transport system permease large subunit